MFFKDPKKLMNCILQDSLDIGQTIPDGAKEYWTDLLGRDSPEEVPDYEDRHDRISRLMDPITEEEVTRFLARKSKGAPGPDGLTWKAIKDKIKELTALFNLWLYFGAVPARVCEGRTTLIPKVPGTEDPGQFRPITVGSVLLRLYHSILGGRLEEHLPISHCQKGFRRGDGLYFNSILLQKCIRKAKTDCRNLRIAFLDMRKAFDSVSHGALWVACRRLGIPEHWIEYCSKFYQLSSTRLVLQDGLSDRITSRRGIKQGDPMSVHLFNAVIDLCVQRLNKNIGFHLGGEVISYMSFADDIVLMAESNLVTISETIPKSAFHIVYNSKFQI